MTKLIISLMQIGANLVLICVSVYIVIDACKSMKELRRERNTKR